MTQINKKNNILYIVSNQIELYITTQINKKNIFCFPCKNACNADSNVLYYRRGQGKPTTIQAAAVKRTKGKSMNTMSTMRENLIDRMVRIYGFEHPVVIQFTDLCERWKDTKENDKVLRIIVESHEEFPVLE